MTHRSGNYYDINYLLEGSPTNTVFVSTLPRLMAGLADNAIAATGVELAVAIAVPEAGIVATNITFCVGGTAAVTPTAGYVVIRDSTGAKLVQSADLTNTARAANTNYTIPLTAATLLSGPALFYIGISFTAGTVPTLRGATVTNAALAGNLGLSAPILSQSHGSAVVGTAPATVSTPTTVAVVPFLVIT